MYKVPAKYKKSIADELKKFIPLVHSLQSRGKTSSEDDARILLNDILSYVLGYDKYNELRTEFKEKNGRLDYIVKLMDGPNKSKKDKFDFVIEAKAIHVELSQHHIDQTMSYCLANGIDYFFLTNALTWRLYKVKRSKSKPDAILLHEVNFGTSNSFESLAEEFYLFSKASYLNDDWAKVDKIVGATKVDDVVAVLLSDKVIKLIARELSEISHIKVSDETVKDIVENQIVKSEVSAFNKKLLSKINEKPSKAKVQNSKNEFVEVVNSTDNCHEDLVEANEEKVS